MSTLMLVVIAIIIIALIVGLYQKNTNALCLSEKKLNGKTVIVTGGTAGMGLEMATEFARRGGRVIIACPFEDEGSQALREVIEATNSSNVLFKLLDLSSLQSTRAFAADILKTEKRLDILVNNAGVGIPKDFLTKDGMSFIMQVNYFGAFLLTILLLPLLSKTGKQFETTRVVNTSSILHLYAQLNINKLNRITQWFRAITYGNSKLCLVLFSRELTKRLKQVSTQSNVVINNVDPGAVGTKIFDSHNHVTGFILRMLCTYLFKTPWQGAQTALHVALDDAAGDVSGEFFKNCEMIRARKKAYDEKLAKQLWEESVRLVKLSDSELDICLYS